MGRRLLSVSVLSLGAVGLAATACDEPVNDVRIKLPSNHRPGGLLCRDCRECDEDRESSDCLSCLAGRTRDRYLFERPCPRRPADGGSPVTLVVDYLPVNGSACSVEGIDASCSNRGSDGFCRPERRDCETVEPGSIGTALESLCRGEEGDEDGGVSFEDELGHLLRAMHESVSAGPVTRDAPDGAVVVRVTYVAGSSEGLDCGSRPDDRPWLEDDSLLGCVFGCAASLDDLESAVILEHGPSGPCSECDVESCATMNPHVCEEPP